MFFPCLVEKLSHPARLPDLCFSLCHSFGVSSQLGLCVLFFQCQFVFVASRQYSVNLSVFFVVSSVFDFFSSTIFSL